MGYDLPPVAAGTKVYNVATENFQYARVFKEGVNKPKSPFILRADDTDYTATSLRDNVNTDWRTQERLNAQRNAGAGKGNKSSNKSGGNTNYVNPETGTNTLWTNSNATKHMGEYVSRFGGESWSIGTRSQAMLESYSASLNKAMETIGIEAPGRYFGTYGNWELGINTETGVVYHARMLN